MQALKAQFEREISSSEEKGEEKRRALSKQVELGSKENIAAVRLQLSTQSTYFLCSLSRPR